VLGSGFARSFLLGWSGVGGGVRTDGEARCRKELEKEGKVTLACTRFANPTPNHASLVRGPEKRREERGGRGGTADSTYSKSLRRLHRKRESRQPIRALLHSADGRGRGLVGGERGAAFGKQKKRPAKDQRTYRGEGRRISLGCTDDHRCSWAEKVNKREKGGARVARGEGDLFLCGYYEVRERPKKGKR